MAVIGSCPAIGGDRQHSLRPLAPSSPPRWKQGPPTPSSSRPHHEGLRTPLPRVRRHDGGPRASLAMSVAIPSMMADLPIWYSPRGTPEPFSSTIPTPWSWPRHPSSGGEGGPYMGITKNDQFKRDSRRFTSPSVDGNILTGSQDNHYRGFASQLRSSQYSREGEIF